MKLEYGKRYVTRNGRVTAALIRINSDVFPYHCPTMRYSWSEKGFFSGSGLTHNLDIVREYAEPNTRPTEPAKPEQTMQTRVIKMAVMPKGEPIFSERATMIEIDDEAAGEFLVISQDHNLPDYAGKIVVDPEEWPAIKSAIEMMIGYIEKAEKEDGE